MNFVGCGRIDGFVDGQGQAASLWGVAGIGADFRTIGRIVFLYKTICGDGKKWTIYSDETIVQVLTILQDEKPTAVRQALAALQEVVRYKPALWEPIGKAVGSVDVYRYKDSMRSLLEKDMQALLAQMKQV